MDDERRGDGSVPPRSELEEKHDQELIELLNELRVALPGVQVLFAFLLIVPFSSRFDVDSAEKAAYLLALCFTVLSLILLTAPSAYHRLRWRERDKEAMLQVSNRLAIAGLASVALAVTSAVFLAVDVLLPRAAALAIVAVAGVAFMVAWFVLPLSRPYDRWDEPGPQ
jgi:predicted membrane channel-forming protein YqfA (hemolysin III family)